MMASVDKGISHDIQKRIEEILQKNKIMTRSIRERQTISHDKEIKLDPSKISMSKTNPKGIIEYANQDFMDACGFEEYELMGQPHSIVRHPSMPKTIFKFMWDRLNHKKGLYAVVKNLRKDGNHYWVITQLSSKVDENGNIISHYAKRKAAPPEVIYTFEKLYRKLTAIEENQSLEVAEKYFLGMLEEKDISYDEFIFNALGADESVLESYFSKPKKNKANKGFFLFRLFKK
jgi:PAS domain S-box-containing protein